MIIQGFVHDYYTITGGQYGGTFVLEARPHPALLARHIYGNPFTSLITIALILT